MAQSQKEEQWSSVGWWAIWTTTFAISLVPPIVHHWRQIPEIIEPFRGSALLPTELLFLRHFGELSHWIPAILIGLLSMGLYKSQLRNTLFAIGTLITAAFSSLYAAYCLIVFSMYLTTFAEAVEKKQEPAQTATSSESN